MNHITFQAELFDTLTLIEQIKQSNWVDKSLVIVNCNPLYSARLSQMINHKLCYLNKDELFESIDLEVPSSIMSQVFNRDKYEYQLFDTYLQYWSALNIYDAKFLFVTTNLSNKNLSKIRFAIKDKLDTDMYRFASLYVEPDKPLDFYVKEITNPLFEWQNSKTKI